MQQLRQYILLLLLFISFCVVFYPSLAQLANKWLNSEDYTHAFMVAPIVGYMIWVKRDFLAENKGRSYTGFIFIVVSLILYLFSLQLQIPTFVFLATNLTLISCFVYLAGFSVFRELAVPFLLLFMLIPIPDQILSTLTYSLQLRVSEVSEFILHIFTIPVFREGNILHTSSKSFMVAEACSGIRSLISMATLSVIIGYFTLSKTMAIALLFMMSLPVAMLINLLRVVALVLADYYWGLDLASGPLHTITGLVLFVFGLTLLFIIQWIIGLWEREKTSK